MAALPASIFPNVRQQNPSDNSHLTLLDSRTPNAGGGLASGVSMFMRQQRGAATQLIGLEPEGAPSMVAALRAG